MENKFELHGKLPPQAVEIEAVVLGAMLLEGNGIEECLDIVKSEKVFYKTEHQLIFKAIKDLHEASKSIDYLTVCVQLSSAGELDNAGGRYYITNLTSNVTSTAHIETHCRILMQAFIKRESITLGQELIKQGYDNEVDAFDLLDYSEKAITAISIDNLQDGFSQIGIGGLEDLERLEFIRKNEGKLTGIDTGFVSMNEITNGWQNGNLIILAARPSVGKTAFALNISLAACKVDKPVAFFSLEMGKEQIRKRLVANIGNVGLTNITSGNLTDRQMHDLANAYSGLNSLKLFIDDSSIQKIGTLRNRVRKMKRKHGIGMVVIDYLQLMSGDSEKGGNREQEISKISRGLKSLAKELSIPIIALSQLNRAVESRGKDKEPNLSDLRESGAIEQDADIVMILYRQDERVNCKIAKNRDGKTGKVTFEPLYDYQRFEDYQEDRVIMSSGYDAFKESPILIPMAKAIAISEARLFEESNNKSNRLDDDELPF